MQWKKYGAIASIVIAVIEIASLAITGATAIVSRLPTAYDFVVTTTFLSPTITFLFGVLLGVVAIHLYDPNASGVPDRIEGCVEIRDTLWKGTARLSGNQEFDINLEPNPLCLLCQTPMKRNERGPVSGGSVRAQNRRALASVVGESVNSSVWTCSSSGCDHTVERDYERGDDAENLLEKHFDRIINSNGEEYSLDSLVENIQPKKVTPREIWREYANNVDDDDVSVRCF